MSGGLRCLSWIALPLLVAVSCLRGPGPDPRASADVEPAATKPPAWVFKDVRYAAPYFFGVGVSAGIKGEDIARAVAVKRAKTELLRTLEQLHASHFDSHGADARLARAFLDASQAAIEATETSDVWFGREAHSKDSPIEWSPVFYARVRLDVAALHEAIRTLPDLTPEDVDRLVRLVGSKERADPVAPNGR